MGYNKYKKTSKFVTIAPLMRADFFRYSGTASTQKFNKSGVTWAASRLTSFWHYVQSDTFPAFSVPVGDAHCSCFTRGDRTALTVSGGGGGSPAQNISLFFLKSLYLLLSTADGEQIELLTRNEFPTLFACLTLSCRGLEKCGCVCLPPPLLLIQNGNSGPTWYATWT